MKVVYHTLSLSVISTGVSNHEAMLRKPLSAYITQLEYFVATVQYGSFSSAARELFVSPQAVSKGVSVLERNLRTQLCERSGRSVKPTPFGRIFFTRATEVLASFADLEALIDMQTPHPMHAHALALALSCSPCRGNALYPSDFSNFEEMYPSFDFKVVQQTNSACLSALEHGVVDAAIIIGRTNNPHLTCVKLTSLPFYVAVSKTHHLSHSSCIHLSDLQGVPLAAPEDIQYCTSIITDHFQAQHIKPCFVQIPPFISEHQLFFERGGVALVLPDKNMQHLYPACVTIPVSTQDLMPLPLCLTHASTSTNAGISLIKQYALSIIMQKEAAMT